LNPAADGDERQLNFMAILLGTRSQKRVRSRARCLEIDGEKILVLVAALSDIIASQRAANRPQDRAVLAALTKTSKNRKPSRTGQLRAIAAGT
jgi:hypothetical protein